MCSRRAGPRSLQLTLERCAVLGSNSFAGAAFVARAISDGIDVLGFGRSAEPSSMFLPYRQSPHADRYTFCQADINTDSGRIADALEAFKPQAVVDFAGQGMVAESWTDPDQWYTTNIVAKVRLHDRLRRFQWLERYIRISTPEVYGTGDAPRTESWDTNPSTPYAVSHAAIDLSLRAFHRHYGFPVVFTRIANFYGPGQQLYRIVPRTIISALTGRRLPLHGGGTSIRAFIYSTDVADGIMRAIVSGAPGEIYHLSPRRFMRIREVVELICRRLGVPFESLVEVTDERPAKDAAYLMNSERARRELAWSDSVSFEEGVDRTITWAQANLDEIRTLPWSYVHKA